MRRILRRLGIGLAALLVLVTAASLVYNEVTPGGVNERTLYAGPYVRVDGTELAYRCWGSHGRAFLLLGGFAEPTWVWHDVGPLLGATHRVCAVDLPPFGYSERSGPYTLAHWTTLTEGFATALRLRRPIVVGHSLGAAVAVAFAADRPSRIRGIVLLDGDALPVGGGGHWLVDLFVPPWATTLYRLATSWNWLVRRVVANAWGDGRPPASGGFLAEWQNPFRVRGTASALRSLGAQGIQGVSKETLRRVSVPRLVVWGARDGVDSVDAGRATAALLRTRFVEIPRAGHLTMLQAPRAVARILDRFAA